MALIDFIKAHTQDINNYQQPAFDWKLKKNGKPYKVIEDVTDHKGPMAEAIQVIPEKLDRTSVVKCFRKDIYTGFVATLLWGGMHKDVNLKRHFKALAKVDKTVIEEKLSRIKKMLEENKPGEALASMLRGIYADKEERNENHIDGISVSYATKLLYFLTNGMSLNHNLRPLIYDQFLANAHCALLTDRDKHIPYYVYDEKDGIMRLSIYILAHTAEIYTHYCKLMAETAEECGIEKVYNLEAWLFGRRVTEKDKEDNPRYISMVQAIEAERNWAASLV